MATWGEQLYIGNPLRWQCQSHQHAKKPFVVCMKGVNKLVKRHAAEKHQLVMKRVNARSGVSTGCTPAFDLYCEKKAAAILPAAVAVQDEQFCM